MKQTMPEPWEDESSPWKTKAAFFSWLRGSLRRGWMRYPLSKNFKQSQCKPNTTGRGKWKSSCAICGEERLKSHLQVDHVESAGSLNSWKDVEPFLRRLFCHTSNLRLLCSRCHHVVTMMERYSLSQEEAEAMILVVQFRKLDPERQKARLLSLGVELPEKSNSQTRIDLYKKKMNS